MSKSKKRRKLKMKKLFDGIIGSLDTKPGNGFAARKLSAMLCFALAVYIHVKFCTVETAFKFLVADFVVALLLLSIITVQDIIKFKNGESGGVSKED